MVASAGFVSMGSEWVDTEEARPAPEGEYDLQVLGVDTNEREDGSKSIIVTIGFEDPELAQEHGTFRQYLNMPTDQPRADQNELEWKRANHFKRLTIKRFLHAFDVEYDDTGFDIEEIPGKRATLTVGQRSIKDGQDIVNELRLPRIN